jgi:hypothetical protein
MAIQSLYVSRNVINAAEIFAWAKAAGLPTVMLPEHLHVTILYSKREFELGDLRPDTETLTISGGPRAFKRLGKDDEPVLALQFESAALSRRWRELIAAGAHSDYPDLLCHISLSWENGDADTSGMEAYDGPIVLGPEIFADIQSDFVAKDDVVEKVAITKVQKIEKIEHGLVFGWGIICKIDGEDYYDHHQDNFTEDCVISGTTDFMIGGAIAKEMHGGEPIGRIVASFPMTTDIAKALEITTRKTGWLLAMKPNEGVLAKFKSGEYKGFSVGGSGEFQPDA